MTTEDINVDRLIAYHKAAIKKITLLKRMQIIFIMICIVSLITGFTFKFINFNTHLIIPLGLIGILFGISTVISGNLLMKTIAKFNSYDETLKKIASPSPNKQSVNPLAIPLTICFANFLGNDSVEMISEDYANLSPLFAISHFREFQQLTNADVLLIYGHLNQEGKFSDPKSSSIGSIIEQTNAAIVIIASPNTEESIQNAEKLPRPKTANIVFTLERNGDGFGRFFLELFEKMRGGKDMLTAWVELAPQNPKAQPAHNPQTILLSEAGNIAFPHQ